MRNLARIEIDNYPFEVVVSQSRRATYYKLNEELPLNIQTKLMKGIYSYESTSKGDIVVDEQGKPLVKNTNKVGKPVTKAINGQRLHDLRMKPYERSRVLKTIKDYCMPIIKNRVEELKLDISIGNYPITVSMIFFTPRESIGDLDNHKAFYEKAIIDILKPTMHGKVVKGKKREFIDGLNVIPDDSVDFNDGLAYRWFEHTSHKLVILIDCYEKLEQEELKHYYLYGK